MSGAVSLVMADPALTSLFWRLTKSEKTGSMPAEALALLTGFSAEADCGRLISLPNRKPNSITPNRLRAANSKIRSSLRLEGIPGRRPGGRVTIWR